MAKNDKRLLLAIATGQAVANVAPLLQVGRPGDRVLWLWSHADSLAAAESVSTFLGQRGLRAQAHGSRVPDELPEIGPWWAAEARLPPLADHDLLLVGNGGTKPQMVALLQAMEPRLSELVYAEAQPVRLWRLPQGQAALATWQPLERPGISLDEVLACSGRRRMPADARYPDLLAWRDGQPTTALSKPPVALTNERDFEAAYLGGGPVLGGDARRWYASAFERAVAQSVVDALTARPQWVDAVAEVWCGTRVQLKDQQDEAPSAEYDVLLVLRNGVLIGIECKSGLGASDDKDDGLKKEMDAREINLMWGGSSLAELWLCSPLPTGLQHPGRLARLHKWREHAARHGRRHLAWPLPGQSSRYWIGGEQHEVPPFVDQIEEHLARYLPPA